MHSKASLVKWTTGGPVQPRNLTKQAWWLAVFSRDNTPARGRKVVQQCPVVRKEGPALRHTKRQSSSGLWVEGSPSAPLEDSQPPWIQTSYWRQVGVWRMSSPSKLYSIICSLQHCAKHKHTAGRGPMTATQCGTAGWQAVWRHWRYYHSAESKHRRLLCLRGAWPAQSVSRVWNGSAAVVVEVGLPHDLTTAVMTCHHKQGKVDKEAVWDHLL